MLKKRQKQILNLILETKHGISGKLLGEKVKVSTRTIRHDIAEMNELFQPLEVKIYADATRGYYLQSADKSLIQEQFLTTEQFSQNLPVTPSERELFIFIKLLWEEDYITMDTLANMIFVSKTTISFDIKRMQERMQMIDNLRLEISPIKGMKFNGSESKKRFLLSNVINTYYLNNLTYLKAVLQNFNIIQMDKFFKLYDIYVHSFDAQGVVLTDQSLYIFTLETLAFAHRIQNHLCIEDTFKPSNAPLISLPFEDLQQVLSCDFDTIERSFLHVSYSYKRILSSHQTDCINNEKAESITLEFLNQLQHDYQVNLKQADNLKQNLALHINTMIQRLQYEHNSDASFIDEIKLTYPFAFEMATSIIPIIRKHLDVEMSETELSYIAVHLAVILDSIAQKKKVAVLCGSGLGTAQLIISRLHNYFHSKVHVVGFFPIYQLNKLLDEHKDIDLILTTLPIQAQTDIPIIHISPLFNQEDIVALNNYIQRSTMRHSAQNKVSIDVCLDENLFFVFDDDKNRDMILKTMVHALAACGYIQSYSLFYSSLMKREKLYSTLYDTIWMPHPMYGMSSTTVMAVGIIKKPKNVELVFMFAINAKETCKFQELYAKIANLLDDKNKIAQFSKVDTYSQFADMFQKL